jgi:hypothetical protein
MEHLLQDDSFDSEGGVISEFLQNEGNFPSLI